MTVHLSRNVSVNIFMCKRACTCAEREKESLHSTMTTVGLSDPLSLIVCDLVTGDALSRQEEGLSHGNHFWICPLC